MLKALVPKAGIEPARPKAHDFESCASTSSATQAFYLRPSTLVSQPGKIAFLTVGGANMPKLCL